MLLCSFHYAADTVQNCHKNSGIEVYLRILHNFRLNPSTEYSEHFKHIKQYRQAIAQPKCQSICLVHTQF